MPTGDRVQVRKDQHGDQHQGIGWDADSVDLSHVEALGSIAVFDGFLTERREGKGADQRVFQKSFRRRTKLTKKRMNHPFES
jgi:hypothetical protein